MAIFFVVDYFHLMPLELFGGFMMGAIMPDTKFRMIYCETFLDFALPCFVLLVYILM
jgi:hypothetical protein